MASNEVGVKNDKGETWIENLCIKCFTYKTYFKYYEVIIFKSDYRVNLWITSNKITNITILALTVGIFFLIYTLVDG